MAASSASNCPQAATTGMCPGSLLPKLRGDGVRLGEPCLDAVDDDHHGLARKKQKAADLLVVFAGQGQRGQGAARLEVSETQLEQRLLLLQGRLGLEGILLSQTLEAAFGLDHVGQDELFLDALKIADGVGGVSVVEVAQHQKNGVALPDLLQGFGIQRFVFDLAFADGYRVRHVEARVGRLSGVEDLRQRIDPLVGDFDADGGMPVVPPVAVCTGECLEKRCLARCRGTDDGDKHV